MDAYLGTSKEKSPWSAFPQVKGSLQVEIIGRHANPISPEKSLEEIEDLLAKLQRSRAKRPKPAMTESRSLEHKLTLAQVAELVAAYKSSTPTTSLTVQYGIGKGSVLKILEEQGVTMRRQPPTAGQVEKAIELYGQGNSLATIANRIGVSQTALRNHLTKADVLLRSRGGSKPRQG